MSSLFRVSWSSVLALVLASSCATVLPMQPASVLPKGALRVGGQVTVAPLCGLSRNFGQDCGSRDGALDLPEVRLGARRGLGDDADFGFSFAVLGSLQSFRPLRLGLTLDGKREWWSRASSPGNRQIVSSNLGAQASAAFGDGNPGSRTMADFDGVASIQFGQQTDRFEFVVSVRYVHRFRLAEIGAPLAPPLQQAPWTQVALGVFRRSPGSWGVQLGYFAPLNRLSTGALQVSYSLEFDVLSAILPQQTGINAKTL
jgi:hypothetical protein